MNYTEIRELRGDRTRAAFAAEVGVDPQTVYRWELAPGSAQARRPRGKVLARLRALSARHAGPAPTPADAAAAPATLVEVAGASDDALPVAAALQRALDGDHHEAEGVFLRAVHDRAASPAVRVLAATGLACIELMFRADSRRALAVLGPVLAAGAPPLALAEAVAALAYSYPDGELFDVGRVHAHAGRAEALARGESAVATALALAAEANAAMMAADDDLLTRALARVDDIAPVSLPEVVAMFLEQLRSLAAARAGQARLANERLDRLLARPQLARVPPIEARVCAIRALRWLEELGDPGEALALARRARAAAEAAHLPIGVHTGLALRSEGEALFRLGRMAEAARVFAEADAVMDAHRFPATIALPAQLRYLLVCGRADELQRQADRLAAVELPSIRGVAQAFAAWFAATAAWARGDDPAAVVAAFAHAERLSERWAPLRRDLLIVFTSAALSSGAGNPRWIFERAQRAADRSPSAWASAQLRRLEGNLLVAEGRFEDGRVALEAAAATFEASGDRVDAALVRFGVAAMQRELGVPGAGELAAAAEAELAAMAVPAPAWIARFVDRIARLWAEGGAPQPDAALRAQPIGAPPGLEIALQRLAVTGASTAMIRRELAAIAQDIARAPVALDDGAAHGEHAVWFDVGGHRRLRLGVTALGSTPLGDDQRAALRVVALVAGLALDAAELRGDTAAPASPGSDELPGVIAASPAMRRVVADVVRLADSHATVVITGESGAGKEVIAQALHRVSPRAVRSYIAFNCAAVPHELFEGQLFGFHKGAFTGATSDQPGVIRAADGGTLFLDEVGELPLDIQPKLLRFLDNAEVFPLGAKRPVKVDVRVIAATNRDLTAEVRRGRFREDLYYRLLVVPLAIPPLRARRDDIVPLARFFARTLVGDGRPPVFAPDALAVLVEHPWPGNVRELRNVIARALAYSPRPDVITRARLGL